MAIRLEYTLSLGDRISAKLSKMHGMVDDLAGVMRRFIGVLQTPGAVDDRVPMIGAQQLAAIGEPMGRILLGRTSLPTRTDLAFTVAEEQRTAMPVRIVGDNMGCENWIPAATSEGILKRRADMPESLHERLGGFIGSVHPLVRPLFDAVSASRTTVMPLCVSTRIDGFMSGLDKIESGQYRFREACGIGDSTEKRATVAVIAAEAEVRRQVSVEGTQKVAENPRKAKESLVGVDLSWKEKGPKQEDADVDRATALYGAASVGMPAAVDMFRPDSAGMGAVSAIAGVGARPASVTVNVESLIGQLVFEGGYEENREQMKHELESALIRILQMADSAL